MKEPRFITAKENKVYEARYYVWMAIGLFVLTEIIYVIQGGLGSLKDGAIIGGAGAVLFLGIGAVTWIQGTLAQRERRKIMENGRIVTGVVTDVEIDTVSAGRGRKDSRYRVIVNYQRDGQEKTWSSPQYKVFPYDYVGLQKECKMYVWGEKCCLAEVPKRKKPTLDELMGEYAFLIPEETELKIREAKHSVFKKEKKEGEIITSAKVKDLDIRYKIEDLNGLDKVALQVARDEWSQLSMVETDAFLKFRSRLIRQAKPIGHFEVFLEVRFISHRICSFSTRYAIEQDFDALVKELNFQYTEKDYDFLKSHIQSRMEESAKKHFGRIPVTEVLVELL